MKDIVYMQQALELAKYAGELGEVPVGALIVDAKGQMIGKGYNQTINLCDPTAHAEIIALREACLYENNYRLSNATIYVSLEPCPMCAGALIQSRIKRLVFSCRDFKSGACGGVINIVNGPASNNEITIDEGILSDKSSKIMSAFFMTKR